MFVNDIRLHGSYLYLNIYLLLAYGVIVCVYKYETGTTIAASTDSIDISLCIQHIHIFGFDSMYYY